MITHVTRSLSEKMVDAWVTVLENIYLPQGYQTPIFLLDAILLPQDKLVSVIRSGFRDATERRSFEARMISRHRNQHSRGLNVNFSFIVSQRAL